MKVVNIKVFTYIKNVFNFVVSLLLRLCRKKPKLKAGDEDSKPISIQIDNGSGAQQTGFQSQILTSQSQQRYPTPADGKDNIVEWTEWNDQYDPKAGGELENPEEEVSNLELFKDMEPVISKPKIVRLKQKKNDSQSSTGMSNNLNKFGIEGNAFHIETELGAWVDEPSGWDEEDIDANEISRESSRLLKEKKKAEREQRALEQLRKKQEKEAQRNQKRVNSQFGVKLN